MTNGKEADESPAVQAVAPIPIVVRPLSPEVSTTTNSMPTVTAILQSNAPPQFPGQVPILTPNGQMQIVGGVFPVHKPDVTVLREGENICQWVTPGLNVMCGMRFTTMGPFVDHIKNTHIYNLDEKKCHWWNCDKSHIIFKAPYKLINHVRYEINSNLA